MRTDATPFIVGQIRRVSFALHSAERRPPEHPLSTFQTVSRRVLLGNSGHKKSRGLVASALRPLGSRVTGFSLGLGLLGRRDMAKLLHHAQSVKVSPSLHYLAVGDPLDSNARYLHLLACRGTKDLRLPLVGATGPKAHYNLVPFGHHILYSTGEVGKGFAVGSGELSGPFYASCFSTSRLIADVVGADDLLDCVEVARVVEKFLHLPAHYGPVLFGHRLPSFLPLSPADRRSTTVLCSQAKCST